MRDPYEILGLAPGAGDAEIKAAYRKLAKQYHPDAQTGGEPGGEPGNAGAQARFQEVTAAYNLLKDAGARARYDQERLAQAHFEQMRRRAAEASMRRSTPFEETPYARAAAREHNFEADRDETGAGGKEGREDIFSELFEGIRSAGKRVFRARGEDQIYRLSVPFIEAATGGTRRVRLPGGKTLNVRIPAGIEDGQQIRLRGQGGDGHGGAPAGDALITVTVEPHERFRREGRDIHLVLPVSLPEAVLGAKIEVPTISGPVTLTIPRGSNTGTRLRLKGKGIRPGGTQERKAAGDQYVTLEIVLPDTDPEPDEALAAFAASWPAGRAHNPRKDFTGRGRA